MFTLHDNAIGPKKALFEEALRRWPAAQAAARREATTHLHQRLSEAALAQGLDPSPLQPLPPEQGVGVVISRTPEGIALADEEYGRPERPPNPVLRTTRTKVTPEVRAVYKATLYRGLGF